MKYIDLSDGRRVAVNDTHIMVFQYLDDGFGNMSYRREFRMPLANNEYEYEQYTAQLIAALVEKLGEQNEPA